MNGFQEPSTNTKLILWHCIAVKSENTEADQSSQGNSGHVEYLSNVRGIPTCVRTRHSSMHIAKCLVLVVFNVKKQCKMHMDCFIQAQFVSISTHLEEQSDNTSKQMLGTYCFCPPSVLSCPISRQIPPPIQHAEELPFPYRSSALPAAPLHHTHSLLATINWHRHWQFTKGGQGHITEAWPNSPLGKHAMENKTERMKQKEW